MDFEVLGHEKGVARRPIGHRIRRLGARYNSR
jgi:hypothetical protein